MDRPKRSQVRHGMASCTRYGCTREECREARRRASRENYHAAKSEGPARVPSDEAYEHAVELIRASLSPIDIAERSGVSVTQVRRLLRGGLPGMLRVNSDAILGVPMPHESKPGRGDGWADATGARRRLQALAIQGFSTTVLSDESGVARLTISDIRAGTQQRICLSTLRVIILLHDRLWDVDPLDMDLRLSAVTRTIKHAERERWLPTEAWDRIDDPACEPRKKPTPKYVRTAEDYDELTSRFGLNRRQAAERLEMSVDAVNAALGYYEKRMAAAS
jgi:transcriptional regulator with XRE-family HTH domain